MRYAYGISSALLLGGATATLLGGFPAGAQVAQNDSSQMAAVVPRAGAPASFADLTAQLQPAVVNIATRQQVRVQSNNPFAGTPFEGLFGGGGGQGGDRPQTREAGALGSGFIISPDGYVVTNNHVITMDNQGVASSITIKMADGQEYNARIVGRDQASDIAVLKIDPKKPLPFVKFGQSSKARAGDWIIAIGNPFGLGGSVTSGIVSSVNRNTGSGAYDHYIQTDASINSGNSGGPMFDMNGNVIGINNWIIAPSGGNIGIGFAIPSDVAAPIVAKLQAGQAIERGYLGVQIQPMTDDLANSYGIAHDKGELVQSVVPGGAAATAGLLPGDVVLKVDGKEVTADNSLSSIVANTTPGKRIPIEVLRGGRNVTVNAVVAKRPSEEELARSNPPTATPRGGRTMPGQVQNEGLAWDALGLSAVPLTPDLAMRLGLPESFTGLLITDVDPSSDAGSKQIQPRMLILEANDQRVGTLAQLETIIRSAKSAGRQAVRLKIQAPGQAPAIIALRLR